MSIRIQSIRKVNEFILKDLLETFPSLISVFPKNCWVMVTSATMSTVRTQTSLRRRPFPVVAFTECRRKKRRLIKTTECRRRKRRLIKIIRNLTHCRSSSAISSWLNQNIFTKKRSKCSSFYDFPDTVVTKLFPIFKINVNKDKILIKRNGI
jgi:hypothetical protein